MPLQATSGAASYDAFGGGVAAVPQYIEDVFSTWLIKPSADFSSYSINNGIDLSSKGGMTWFKARDAAQNHLVYDTARGSSVGAANALVTNNANGQQTTFFDYVTPNTNGFTVNYAAGGGQLTNSGINYASWTFRKQPKFFDVVTYTGNGSNRTIAHSLGSVPGCIMVKRTDGTAQDWNVYHRSIGNTFRLLLNANAEAYDVGDVVWNATTPTSTVFSLGTNSGVNSSGGTYVAYLFAHNAGGFGLTGTDNVISCGSFTTDGSGNATVDLGYEPQWLLSKASGGGGGSWIMFDNMRGFGASTGYFLFANNPSAEGGPTDSYKVTSTGFTVANVNTSTQFIYIAIRRGPMKVPTDGTKVFAPVVRTGTGSAANITGLNFPPDLFIGGQRSNFFSGFVDRLRGYNKSVYPYGTFAEQTSSSGSDVTGFLQNGISVGTNYLILLNGSGESIANYFFQRAPGFFDEVCFDSSSTTLIPHNLTVVPELIIGKDRTGSGGWYVWQPSTSVRYGLLNSTAAFSAPAGSWPATSTTFEPLIYGSNIVNYLFATCPGVSKVFSFTGNGTTQTINCGFTGGARFVLLKATSTTGGWYVYDTARGMTTLTDPYLQLNSTAAESATLGSVTTVATGFAVNESVLAGVNTNGVSYIGLAIS